MDNSMKKRKAEKEEKKKKKEKNKQQIEQYKIQLISFAQGQEEDELVLTSLSKNERITLHEHATSIGLKLKYRRSDNDGWIMIFYKSKFSDTPHICLKEESIRMISQIKCEELYVENPSLINALNIRRHTCNRIQLTKPPKVTSKNPNIDRVRKSLPVFGYRENILQTIKDNQIVVITAETGILTQIRAIKYNALIIILHAY